MEAIHSLCLLEGDRNKGYPELYDKIASYAAGNYAIIYAVEDDITRAVRRMSYHGMEVEALVESGVLTIVDRNTMYSIERTELDGHALLNSWHSVMLKVKRRSSFDGILAIGSADNFFGSPSHHDRLVEYEQMIGKNFHIQLEAICCYNTKTMGLLSFGQIVALLNAHHSTVHSNSRYRQWEPRSVVELARRGLSRALGSDEASELIFKTMKLCYKIDESHIASDTMMLERMLFKLLGKEATGLSVSFIKDEVMKSISF